MQLWSWTQINNDKVMQHEMLVSVPMLGYGHVLRKDDDDWVKKCMEYDVEGSRPRGRPRRIWKEVVREDCQARGPLQMEKGDKGSTLTRLPWNNWKMLVHNRQD